MILVLLTFVCRGPIRHSVFLPTTTANRSGRIPDGQYTILVNIVQQSAEYNELLELLVLPAWLAGEMMTKSTDSKLTQC